MSVKLKDKKEAQTPLESKKEDGLNFDNKSYKIVYSLRKNIADWGEYYGAEKLFFMTLTFPWENGKPLTDPIEAQRRFNNFNRQFNRIETVQWAYKGIELQKSGAIHFHIVGIHDHDLGAETFDWDSLKKAGEYFTKKDKANGNKYKRLYSRSANNHLQEMWSKVRSIGEGSGFGICEFLPVRSANCIANYVGKYLGKSFGAQADQMQLPKGVRKFSYSPKVRQMYGRQFSWINNESKKHKALPWRQKVHAFAHVMGVKESDFKDMKAKFGPRWAHNWQSVINHFGPIWYPYLDQFKFGQNAPRHYPTGILGNPKELSLEDPFETSESELFDSWMNPRNTRSSMSSNYNHFKKWQRAQKEKKLYKLKYGD